MNSLAIQLARSSETGPEALAGLWTWLRGTDTPVLEAIVAHRHCPPDVLAEAAASSRAEVRTAWLLRPERTVAELVDAVGRERRGDVLAAVAVSPLIDDATVEVLAALRKRAVAWALLGRAEVSDAAVADVVRTLAPALRTATIAQAHRLLSWTGEHGAAVARVVTEITHPQLLLALVERDVALDDDAQLHVLRHCLTHVDPAGLSRLTYWEQRNYTQSTVTTFARYRHLSVAAAAALLEWAEGQKLPEAPTALLDALRLQGGGEGAVVDRIEQARTTSDLEQLDVLWAATGGAQRVAMARALWANPSVRGERLVAAAAALGPAEVRAMSGDIAAAVAAGRIDDDDLVAAAVAVHSVPAAASLLAHARNEPGARLAALEQITHERRYVNADELIDQGILDEENFRHLPCARLAVGNSRVRAWVETAVVDTCRRDPRAWGLLDQLWATHGGETLDRLLILIAASVGDADAQPASGAAACR